MIGGTNTRLPGALSLLLGAMTMLLKGGLPKVVTSSPLAPTVEIAPGVQMPKMALGMGDRAAWFTEGGRAVDTAYTYGDEDQQAVRKAVTESGLPRSTLFVTTKVPCCPSPIFWCRKAIKPFLGELPQVAGMPGEEAALTETLMSVIDHDIELLGGRPDLLLLHNSCGSAENSVRAYKVLEEALKQGKARAIGISNFNASEIEALVAKTSVRPAFNQCGFAVGVSQKLQPAYSLESDPLGKFWNKGGDMETMRKCQDLGITYGAYGPLGQTTNMDVMHHQEVVNVAAQRGVSTAQVALRWVTQQGVVATTGGFNPVHMVDNLQSFSLMLSKDEMQRLSAVHYTSVSA